MSNYKVVVAERLSKTLIINAENEDAAEDIARCMYKNNEIVLTADDYEDTTIETILGSSETDPPIREVYVKVGTEVVDHVPINFMEYQTFWESHRTDAGFAMVYLDRQNRIVN